jgi:hypothetical protein
MQVQCSNTATRLLGIAGSSHLRIFTPSVRTHCMTLCLLYDCSYGLFRIFAIFLASGELQC